MDEAMFVQEAEKYGVRLSAEQLAQLRLYASLLQEWNGRMNLTAITETEEIYEKHFLDSLTLFAADLRGRIADVGSGAGFPGMVLAIADPELDVYLIDPIIKRCTFLREVVKQLHLMNVTVLNVRAEDAVKEYRETFGTVTARAVAALPELAELCVPLVVQGGRFIAMKGAQGKEELERAGNALQILGCGQPEVMELCLPEAGERCLICFTKERKTPAKYPRNYGQIRKHPLH